MNSFSALEKHVIEMMDMEVTASGISCDVMGVNQCTPVVAMATEVVKEVPLVNNLVHAEEMEQIIDEEESNDATPTKTKKSLNQLRLFEQIRYNKIKEKTYELKLNDLELRKEELDLKKKI